MQNSRTRQFITIIFMSCLLFITGCSGFQFPGVYKIDIPQGNIIDNKDLKQVKVGMTKEQVKFLLGTPLVTDTFSPNRWDYSYSMRKGSTGKRTQKHLTLMFEGDTLASLEGSAITEMEKEEQLREVLKKALKAEQKKQQELKKQVGTPDSAKQPEL